MAADVAVGAGHCNPCCDKLLKTYLKPLKKVVKILEEEKDELQKENVKLKMALDDKKLHRVQEREEKEKESSIRQKVEKEIEDLKAENSSFQYMKSLRSGNEDENQLLKARILELEKFEVLIEKERKRSDSAMKKSESDKKKAEEAWKLVKMERKNAEEERRYTESETKKAEEYKRCLERLKSEAKELKDKLSTEQSRANDALKKVEAEKIKVTIERKRADSEASKAEEWKRLLEVERKKKIDEKLRADSLSQMLEEENKKREELQKKMEETVLTSEGTCDLCKGDNKQGGVANVGSGIVKLLREQLRLEKKQVKHAKRMAKLEKAKKSFVFQEFHLLKHSFMQVLSRFNMLDNHISHSIEGTDAVAKIRKSPDVHGIKLHDNLLGCRGNDNSTVDSGLAKTCWTGSFNLTESTKECIDLPLSRGSCSRPTTGTISELESPIRASRKRSKSPAVCFNKSVSDKRSMGSQERDTIVEKSNVLELPTSRISKKRRNKDMGVIPNDAEKSPGDIVSLSKPMLDTVEVADEKLDCRLKRRKVHDTTIPGVIMHTKGNQLHKIGKRLSAFEDVLNKNGGIPATNCSQGHGLSQNLESRNTKSENLKEVCGKNCNPCGYSRTSKQHPHSLKGLVNVDNDKHQNKINKQGKFAESCIADTVPSSHQAKANVSIEQTPNVLGNERADLICFERLILGKYLKLLDLDNDADEEKYRIAMEMPLSPTLPEIEFCNIQQCGEDNSCVVMGRDKSVAFNSFDVTDMEIRESNTKNLLTHESHCYPHPTKEQRENCLIKLQNAAGQHDILDNIKHTPFPDKDGSLDIEQTCHAGVSLIDNVIRESVHQQTVPLVQEDKIALSDELAKLGIEKLPEASKQTSLSARLDMADSSRANGDLEFWPTPVLCVVPPNIRDKDSLSRMLCAGDTLTHQNLISPIDNVVLQVHSTLAVDTVLMPEEKAGMVFSSLLCSITSRMSAKSKYTMTRDFLPCLDFFVAEIARVFADGKTRLLLEEICQLDVLASLIQSFLITRKVVLFTDRHSVCKDQSWELLQLDGTNRCAFSGAVTVDQFVAGCTILASISAATDQFGFVLDASYKILRISGDGISWILLALHIFASVCGKKFFNFEEYSFLIIAMKSVVLYIEKGHKSVRSISPSLISVYDMGPSYPCQNCPFAAGAVCMEKLIDLLLDVLQCYSLTGVGEPNAITSVASSVCKVSSCTESAKGSNDHRNEIYGLTSNCHASLCLFKFNKEVADLPDCFPEIALCHFADIVSLVELVGCYMSWVWIFDRIMPRLSMMLESCTHEEFSAALFVLIGQLGRFCIDVSGSEQKGIAELRCRLSLLIDRSIARKRSLPTQVSAIGALLKLLPFSFRDVVGRFQEATLDTSQSDHAQVIKKWFSQLSKKHQSLILNYFVPSNFQDNVLIA